MIPMENDIYEYLYQGENQSLEFKQRLSSARKIAKTMCAFANTEGGVILVGIKDNKDISGVDPAEERHILEEAAQYYCNPSIPLLIEEIYLSDDQNGNKEKVVLKVTITASEEKPHFAQNSAGEWKAYFRSLDTTLMAGKKAIKQLQNTQKPAIGDDISMNANEQKLVKYLEKNNRIALKEYMSLVNISYRRARRELQNMLEKGIIRIIEHEKEDYFVL